MKIENAVITAAARSQRSLALQSLVDRDGVRKSVLRILVEEMKGAGARQVGVVIVPGDESAYRDALDGADDGVRFLPQTTPRGYGHALWCAKEFVGDAPFLHQVGDHIFLSEGETSAARHLVDVATHEDCAVCGVQPTRENLLPYFGTIGGRRIPGSHDTYLVERVVEKPTPTDAEQELAIPGLRAGNYLCFVGTHVLSPTVMELLDAAVGDASENESVQLSPVLNEMASREKFLAVETPGRRHPIDTRYGLLHAQLALALSGDDRDDVLAGLVELLATRSRTEGAGL